MSWQPEPRHTITTFSRLNWNGVELSPGPPPVMTISALATPGREI
ncbi:MAG: hypothetical protein P4L91_00995 [Burkholderiaceae bacterium]|nr:hypothetical protein [Burkholderiaceae bacterium]